MITKTALCVSCLVIFATVSNARIVNIMGRNYLEKIALTERELPIPNKIRYSGSEILIFMERETVSFSNLDFTRYKIEDQNKNNEKEPQNFEDLDGNLILNINGFLLYSSSSTGLERMIVSEDHQTFKDLALDRNRSTAYMIGVDHDDFTGRVFIFNTKNPKTTDAQVILEEISQLGDRIKSLSVDPTSGNIALVEHVQGVVWKLAFLQIVDAEILKQIAEEYQDLDETFVFNTTGSQLRNTFNSAVHDMMNIIISTGTETCDTRTSMLLAENQRLRYEISLLIRKRQIILERSNVKFANYNDALLFDTPIPVDKGLKKNFKIFVKNVEKNITSLLDENTVIWLDDNQTEYCQTKVQVIQPSVFTIQLRTPNMADSKKCGLISDNLTSDVLPWTVVILKLPFPLKVVCYGTLVHPKLVIVSSRCPFYLYNKNDLIVRNSKLDPNQSNTRISSLDRSVASVVDGAFSCLILDNSIEETFEKSPVCLPKHESTARYLNAGLQCYALKAGVSEYKVEVIQASQLVNCPSGNSYYHCIYNDCNGNANIVAVYCPSITLNNFQLRSIYAYTKDCHDVFTYIGIFADYITTVARTHGIDMTAYTSD